MQQVLKDQMNHFMVLNQLLKELTEHLTKVFMVQVNLDTQWKQHQSAILAIGTSAGTTATYTTASALAATTNAIAVASFVGNNLMNDSEFSSSNAAGIAAGTIFTVRVAKAGLGDFDAEGIRAFGIDDANDKITAFYPQYTRIEGDNVEFVVKVAAAAHAYGLGAVTVTYQKGPDNLNDRGDFEEGKNGTTVGGENNSNLSIPEINVALRSDTVAAKTRKLKAQWTPEFAQDLNAYHSIDAEAELTSILSEYISMEIDLEILDMLIKNADTVEGWSAKVGNDVTVNDLTNANTTAGGTDQPTFTMESYTQVVYTTLKCLGSKL
jgi:hypothetical protein